MFILGVGFSITSNFIWREGFTEARLIMEVMFMPIIFFDVVVDNDMPFIELA